MTRATKSIPDASQAEFTFVKELFGDKQPTDGAEQVRQILDGLGLARDADAYTPGTWSLAEEGRSRGRTLVISGIRSPGGETVSVRLTVRQSNSATQVWRAIQGAIGSGKYPQPGASLWRRLWSGGSYIDAAGLRRRAAGIREGLLAASAAAGESPSYTRAPLSRPHQQKTRLEGATSGGQFSVDAGERLKLASPLWRRASPVSKASTPGDPDDSRDRSQH